MHSMPFHSDIGLSTSKTVGKRLLARDQSFVKCEFFSQDQQNMQEHAIGPLSGIDTWSAPGHHLNRCHRPIPECPPLINTELWQFPCLRHRSFSCAPFSCLDLHVLCVLVLSAQNPKLSAFVSFFKPNLLSMEPRFTWPRQSNITMLHTWVWYGWDLSFFACGSSDGAGNQANGEKRSRDKPKQPYASTFPAQSITTDQQGKRQRDTEQEQLKLSLRDQTVTIVTVWNDCVDCSQFRVHVHTPWSTSREIGKSQNSSYESEFERTSSRPPISSSINTATAWWNRVTQGWANFAQVRSSSQMKRFLFHKSRLLLSTTILLHCNYQEGIEEQFVVYKFFKIITQQLKSILKNILFWWIDCLNAVFYYNYLVFIICEDALLKSGVHSHKVFNKKVRKYMEEWW